MSDTLTLAKLDELMALAQADDWDGKVGAVAADVREDGAWSVLLYDMNGRLRMMGSPQDIATVCECSLETLAKACGVELSDARRRGG